MMTGQDRHSWQKAVAHSQLPPGARLVAHSVALYTDPTGGQGVWLSSSDLVNLTGMASMNTVNKYLRMLRDGGWLRTEDGARFLEFPGELTFAGGPAAGMTL